MKKHFIRAACAPLLMFAAALAFGQSKPETITLPLSRPGEPVSLEIDMLSARIEVIGEDRKDVELTVTLAGGQRKIVMPSGTKTLAGGGELEINERDNSISVSSDAGAGRATVVARIPRRAKLELSTTNDGAIVVRDIVGDLELENVNGPISATNIDGSVIAETVNDAITVALSGVSDDSATALSSLNGDITLTLPADAGVELRLDTPHGRIVSDFELDVKASKPVIERSQSRGGVSVRMEDAVVASINGGGPLIRMKTLNGAIRIGKAGS